MNQFNPIIPDSFAAALGQTLMHSFWQLTLLGLGLWLVLFLFPKAGAAVRYRLGAITISLMLAIPIGTFLMVYEPGTSSGTEITVTSTEMAAASGANAITPMVESLSGFISQNAQVLSLIWLLGALVFAIRFIGGYARLHSLKSLGTRAAPTALYGSLESLMERMNIRRKVGLFESNRISVPMVIGVLKPVILLPVSLPDTLNQEQLEYILAHELAHVKRWDFMVNLFQSLVEILLFFHPAVWLTSRFLRTERENCCDDLVLQVKENKLSYARALVNLEAARQNQSRLTLAATGGELTKRIKKITGANESRRNYSHGITALLLTFAMLSGLFLSTPDTVKAAGFSNDGPPPFFTERFEMNHPAEVPQKPLSKTTTSSKVNTTSLSQIAADEKAPDDQQTLKLKTVNFDTEQNTFGNTLAAWIDNLFSAVVDTPRAKKVIFEDEGKEIIVGLDGKGGVNSVKIDGQAQPASSFYKYQKLVDAELGNNQMERQKHLLEAEKRAEEAQRMAKEARAQAEEARERADRARREARDARRKSDPGNPEGIQGLEEAMQVLAESMEAIGKTLSHSLPNMPTPKFDSLKGNGGWSEEFEASMEEFGEKMGIWGEEFGKKFEAEWGEEGKEFEAKMEVLGKKIEQEVEASMKKMGRDLENMDWEKWGREIEKNAGEMARKLEATYGMEDISSELKKDGLIRKSDKGFNLDIDESEMKVNGKRVSRELHQKYLQLFRKKGIKVESKVKIRVKD